MKRVIVPAIALAAFVVGHAPDVSAQVATDVDYFRFHNALIQFSNAQITAVGSGDTAFGNLALVTPGSIITVEADYQIIPSNNPADYASCPGCVIQFYVAWIAPAAAEGATPRNLGLWSGTNSLPGSLVTLQGATSGHFVFNTTAPTTPGEYRIGCGQSLDFVFQPGVQGVPGIYPLFGRIVDFETLAQAGSGTQSHGTSYTEDGFDFSGTLLTSFNSGDSRFAGSTGLFDNSLNTPIILTKQGGGSFDLTSIELSPLNNNASVTTVTFDGFLGGNPVATQQFTTATAQSFQRFAFNSDFANVDQVTWIQTNNGGTTDFHQFDNVVMNGRQTFGSFLVSVVTGPPAPCDGDANSDGVVNFADITNVLANWLTICP